MRANRAWAAPLVAVVLWTAGIAPLLPSEGGGVMPCCAEGRPCDTALEATGCSRLDAASERAVGLAALVRPSGPSKAYLAQVPATPASFSPASSPSPAAVAPAEDPPPRGVAVPLYQLNSALLC
jgi:hypothetical protein